MLTKITAIIPGSPASKTIIAPGDVLRRINGNAIGDVLDYEYYSYDRQSVIELTGNDGTIKLIRLSKPEGADLGLVFESSLMDKQRSCANKCIFCFIDQLPKGMRKTLYYKDDDVRLSFLQGNYVTLTNLGREDIERIIRLRISPINVSVHTLDPELRDFMLGRREDAKSESAKTTEYISMLAKAGITLNCQIVCCPGVNDKKELSDTIEGLMKLGGSINSVSVVPVGLTKYRDGLHKLRAFDRKLAKQTVRQIEHYGRICSDERGNAVFYCADELYMKAELKLPPDNYYADYPQLENGVGMMRLFITEFLEAMGKRKAAGQRGKNGVVSIATGTLAAPYLKKLVKAASKNCGTIRCDIYPIKNNFFGDCVTVSGLVTGGDIIEQLKGKKLGRRLLIPQNMLRHNDVVFLDDITVSDVSNALGIPVKVVGQSGAELFEELYE